eukprot:s13_g49.t1
MVGPLVTTIIKQFDGAVDQTVCCHHLPGGIVPSSRGSKLCKLSEEVKQFGSFRVGFPTPLNRINQINPTESLLMAGAAIAQKGELHVLLVRHGESSNNPLMAEIFGPVAGEAPGSAMRQLAEQRWLRERSTDPGLTQRGLREAEHLAASCQKMLPSSVKIFVSPFLRTLQTAAPLAKALKSKVVVHPLLYEVGGVYVESEGQRHGPGACLSPSDMERDFPDFDISHLSGASNRGWYQGGWETDAAARQRCQQLLSWLQSLREEQPNGWAVLVIHGHLIDLLLKALLGIVDDPLGDLENENVMERRVVFFTPNCATAHVSLRPDGSVAVRHIALAANL